MSYSHVLVCNLIVLPSCTVNSEFYFNLCWTLYNFYPRGTHHLKDNTQVLVLWFWNLTAWTALNCAMSDNDWCSTHVHRRGWRVRALPPEMFCCPVLRFILKLITFGKSGYLKSILDHIIRLLPMQFTGNDLPISAVWGASLNIFIYLQHAQDIL